MSIAGALSGFAFASCALDRADALRDDADAVAALWPAARVLVLDADGSALVGTDGTPLPLTGAQLGGGPGTAIFLGLEHGTAWFCVDAEAVPVQAPARLDLRSAAGTWSASLASVFAYARGMNWWQARTRFCGVCGGAIEFRRAGFVGHCARCGNDHFPRVDPAVIAAVSDGRRLLLGRQASWPPRRYSVIAGFVEPGESLEQTVVREVHEETGVRVTACRYLGAQPWPFPGALMLGFAAQAEPDAPRVTGELEDARWVEAEELRPALYDGDREDAPLRLPPALSIARALIADWYHAHAD